MVDQYCQAKIMLWTSETIYNIPIKEIPYGLERINIAMAPYAALYPGASLMALKVVLPELLLPPLMVIVILPPNPRYHSRVSPAARLRKIDLHFDIRTTIICVLNISHPAHGIGCIYSGDGCVNGQDSLVDLHAMGSMLPSESNSRMVPLLALVDGARLAILKAVTLGATMSWL